MAENNFVDDMIPYVEFADNANERTPCVLVLDCSGSMRGEPIKQLNVGLKALEKELKEDIDASSRVQLLIIKAFGKDETEVSADWIDAMNFTAPEMAAGGLTPLGKAMELALQNRRAEVPLRQLRHHFQTAVDLPHQRRRTDRLRLGKRRPQMLPGAGKQKSGHSRRRHRRRQPGKTGALFAQLAQTSHRAEIYRIFPLAQPQRFLHIQSGAERRRPV